LDVHERGAEMVKVAIVAVQGMLELFILSRATDLL
jgi:hypothetical protein